jgi:hypothetical protein
LEHYGALNTAKQNATGKRKEAHARAEHTSNICTNNNINNNLTSRTNARTWRMTTTTATATATTTTTTWYTCSVFLRDVQFSFLVSEACLSHKWYVFPY